MDPNVNPSRRSSSDPNVHLPVTNENWRGKNDPTERRRIQNRLNQRAFRQRQKEGASPKQYRPRTSSSEPSPLPDEDDEASTSPSPDEDLQQVAHQGQSSSMGVTPRNHSGGWGDPSTGRVWDELAELINRNFLAAATSNALRLGINQAALQSGTSSTTPRSSSTTIPASLEPTQPQHLVAHDPIIDIIPHPRLRVNILRAIASQQLDAAVFGKDLRASGALENMQDGSNSSSSTATWQRCGLVVWSAPEQLASWELSEGFLRKWGFLLLQGCEDILAATNTWRGRRGETLFPSSVISGR